MMLQLRRILPGDDIEEDHMRNRQLVASWAVERGQAENVIERKVIEDKTYFIVNDYDKLRGYFGELLREIQRIKSEGDFEAGRTLVETYGVKVDQAIHAEVLRRSEPLILLHTADLSILKWNQLWKETALLTSKSPTLWIS
jgi:dipeptidyl-peptidase-3